MKRIFLMPLLAILLLQPLLASENPHQTEYDQDRKLNTEAIRKSSAPLPTSSLWLPEQIDTANTYTSVIYWAEANIHGGFTDNPNGNKTPAHPIPWEQIWQYASLPAREWLLQPPAPQAGHEAVELRLWNDPEVRQRVIASGRAHDAFERSLFYMVLNGAPWNGRAFDLHFEEVFGPSNGNFRFKQGRRFNADLVRWGRPPGWNPALHREELVAYILQADGIYLESVWRVWVKYNVVHWEAIIINHSTTNWSHPGYFASGVLLCMHHRLNPDWDDQFGERRYYHHPDGQRMADSMRVVEGHDPDPYFGEWVCCAPHDIAVSNKVTFFNQMRDMYTVMSAEPPRSIVCNCSADINCVHTNVGWSVPPGQWRKVSAKIEFHGVSRANPEWLR